jgi:hypothetical protein
VTQNGARISVDLLALKKAAFWTPTVLFRSFFDIVNFRATLGQSTGAGGGGQKAEWKVVPPQRSGVPKAPDLGQLNQDKAH